MYLGRNVFYSSDLIIRHHGTTITSIKLVSIFTTSPPTESDLEMARPRKHRKPTLLKNPLSIDEMRCNSAIEDGYTVSDLWTAGLH
jgi:hypothetical protein